MDIKKLILIGILLIILLALVGFILGSITHNPENVKNVTTPYGTTCTLNIGEGMLPDETGVTDETQVLAFTDGIRECYFISTTKDIASDLIYSIQSGTKCRDGDVVWYHLEDKELVNGFGAFGTHLKLKTTNEMNAGFMENPNNDEVIVLVAPPDTIIDCFNSIKWGQ